MILKYALSLGLVLSAAALTACGDSSSGSAAPASGASGAATAKPAATATATAAATAKATAAPAAAGIVGIAADEMFAVSCESISKDSECADIVVKAEAEKAENIAAMKKICGGTVAEKACSTDKIIGTCRVMKNIIVHYSSEGPKKYDADSAKKACEKGHGRWVTP